MKVIVANPELFQSTLKAVKMAGRKSLVVVSDFDHTLTEALAGGKNLLFSQISRSGLLGVIYEGVHLRLYSKYQPLEIATDISETERQAHMLNWLIEGVDHLMKLEFSKDIINQIVETCTIKFRGDVYLFLYQLDIAEIPLYIVSGGIGEMIELYLKKEKCLFKNIKVISNYFHYNNYGSAIKLIEPVYNGNKKEVLAKNIKINFKPNILLIGDMLDDTRMADKIDYTNILKIGFCHNLHLLKEYKEVYDVVLLADEAGEADMTFLNNLIQQIIL